MNQFVALCQALTHFQQAFLPAYQYRLVFVVPKIHSYLFPFQKAYLFLWRASQYCPITQFHKEILPHYYHFKNFEVEAINLHQLTVLVDGKNIFECKGDMGGSERVCG